METKQTTNYDIFKAIIGNRAIYQPHVARLISSIERKNMLAQNPIIVNEKMEVVDGQHRLLAAKALGVPVFYTIVPGANLVEIQLLNANNREWLLQDYLDSYVALGKKDYMRLQDFANEYRISLSISILVLSDQYGDNRGLVRKFREGRFEIGNYITAERMASLIMEVRRHSPDQAFAHRACIKALRKLLDKVDPKVFTTKLEQYQTLITRRASVKDYLRQFDNLMSAGGQTIGLS